MTAPQVAVTIRELRSDHKFGSKVRNQLRRGIRVFVVGYPQFILVKNGPAVLLLDGGGRAVGTYYDEDFDRSVAAAIGVVDGNQLCSKRGGAA